MHTIAKAFFRVLTKKRYFQELLYGLEPTYQIAPQACISSKRSFVYHQGESLVYHHCERRYSLWLMIYTFGDEIHAKAWWYTIAFAMDKKNRQVETCRFFWWIRRESNPRPKTTWYEFLRRQLIYCNSPTKRRSTGSYSGSPFVHDRYKGNFRCMFTSTLRSVRGRGTPQRNGWCFDHSTATNRPEGQLVRQP